MSAVLQENQIIQAIRASSISELFDCPARWSAKYLDGMRMPRSAPAQIGTAVHASTAVFDKAKLDGSPVTPDDASEALVDAIKHPEEEVDWGDTSIDKAIRVGLGVHTRYCTDIAPTQNYIAVEQGLDPLDIDMNNGVIITLTGTTDRVRKVGDEYGVSDVKTGQRACNPALVKKHKPQIGVYDLLAEKNLGLPMTLPGEIIQMQTSSNYKVAVEPIEEPRKILVGTEDHPGLLQFAADMLKAGLFYGNSSSMLCSDKYCPAYQGCWFK